ncbi:MAG TPA: peroxiredoxin [Bacteroidia bacterium]|nr:peroxiredoxin [Bacteroidia bacterium]
MLPIDTIAPDFSLQDQTGKTFRLGDALKNGPVVLYFYPKNETYGCTKEACFFRDAYEDFVAAGTQVVGVSADSIASHQRFIANHRLPFTLLSDPSKAVHRLFGVEKGFLGILSPRVTFVIDRQGRICKSFSSSINIEGHVTESLKILQAH